MKKQITEFKEAMQAYITAKKACDRAEEEMAKAESEESERASTYPIGNNSTLTWM